MISAQLERFTRLEDAHVFTVEVVGQPCAQSLDGVKCSRTDMLERPPVKGNEVPRLGSLEKVERIVSRQMATTEARLPPGRVPDGEKSDIELPFVLRDMFVDKS